MLKRREVPFLTVIGLLPFVLAACNDATSSTDPRTQPPLVRIEAVEISVQSERSFTGIVAARVQSDLGFRVPGKVLERLVDAGQPVKRGQPLMRIDPTDLRLAMRAHEEAVAAARARAHQTAEDEVRHRDLLVPAARFRHRTMTRPRLPPSRQERSSMRPEPRPTLPATRRATLSCSLMRTVWWSRLWRSRGRSSLPARSSSVWRMPDAARRSSNSPKPCARRSDPPAARPCMEVG